MNILGTYICVALFALSQTPAPSTASAPMKNAANQWLGRFWKILDKEEKGAFVMGFTNAADEVALIATKGSRSSQLRSLFVPKDLTGAEIIEALDKFYDVPENSAVPIVDAMSRISIRAARLSQESIKKLVDDPCGN